MSSCSKNIWSAISNPATVTNQNRNECSIGVVLNDDMIKNSTLRKNKNYINNYIIPLVGKNYLSRLTPYEVQTSLINPLQEKVNYRTTYNIYCTFIAILDFMVDNEKLKRNKISEKMHFKEEDAQPIFYNQNTLKIILN